MSLLHQAAAVGYLKTAAFALQHGAEPNIVDRDGNSPLHYAGTYTMARTADSKVG
jgi:ankyrin repeat protein